MKILLSLNTAKMEATWKISLLYQKEINVQKDMN